MRLRLPSAAAAVLCAAAVAGCGVGAGEDTGTAELTVTRDYGAERLQSQEVDLRESDTVLSVLDQSVEVKTRYGGGFVQSIDGLSGGSDDGRRSDWFFYVNGIESPVGAAEYAPGDGDRIWWDHHDWSTAMRVPAVVGSWPEPFVHGFQDKRLVGGRLLRRRRGGLRPGEPGPGSRGREHRRRARARGRRSRRGRRDPRPGRPLAGDLR